jgi:hypothetical protein
MLRLSEDGRKKTKQKTITNMFSTKIDAVAFDGPEGYTHYPFLTTN